MVIMIMMMVNKQSLSLKSLPKPKNENAARKCRTERNEKLVKNLTTDKNEGGASPGRRLVGQANECQ